MRIYISHGGHYDYEHKLYQPLRESSLASAHQLFLPHEPQNKDATAREQLAHTDLLVAEASHASTGQGIELGLAAAAGVPIVCFYQEGAQPSGSLRFVTSTIIPYTSTADLLAKLTAEINKRQ